ncbi:hypothetical protein EVAR_32177_1 [Eumeta japonica]|uniref:Reverse transcriptase domain-containing protein n=1 Tax=Eumeta variegata TaxID=151549 RepID=A0A4C1VXR2_EUMVA|nr:hypothetical protein EVAR_32177_1 [Eumeta japonica]
MVGPTVQDDLLSILLRFRQHKYVLSADVEKMYQQIVHPDDRHLQQIVWRDSPTDLLKTFQLKTVSYGTVSAPYLATQCLQQLGFNYEDIKISDIIVHDFYVDDLTGGDDIDEVQSIRKKIESTLAFEKMEI